MDYKEYLKHLSIVILGILIAFWLNSVATGFKEKKNQKEILQYIYSEQLQNRTNLAKSLSEINGLCALVDSVSKGKNHKLKLGFTKTDLNTLAFETAKYSAILKDINYNLASHIVGCYQSYPVISQLEDKVWEELLLIMKNKQGINDTSLSYLYLNLDILRQNLETLAETQQTLISELQIICQK